MCTRTPLILPKNFHKIDQISHTFGWMEGAVTSAWSQIVLRGWCVLVQKVREGSRGQWRGTLHASSCSSSVGNSSSLSRPSFDLLIISVLRLRHIMIIHYGLLFLVRDKPSSVWDEQALSAQAGLRDQRSGCRGLRGFQRWVSSLVSVPKSCWFLVLRGCPTCESSGIWASGSDLIMYTMSLSSSMVSGGGLMRT